MELPEDVAADVKRRLRKAAGQIAGIEKMLEQGRDCRDIVTQISAASHALEQAGLKVVSAGMRYCLSDPEAAAADGYPLAEIERLFMKLA